MTTHPDPDRRSATRLAVRASSLALGLAASLGLQLGGGDEPAPAPLDPRCRIPAGGAAGAL